MELRRTGCHATAILVAAFSFLLASTTPVEAQSASVTADFASPSTALHPIPPGMFGLNPAQLPTAAVSLIGQAGFTEVRRVVATSSNYATPTPDWTTIEWAMAQAQRGGLHPLVTLTGTPDWLLPSPNPCVSPGDPSTAPPSDIQKWAQIAASYV